MTKPNRPGRRRLSTATLAWLAMAATAVAAAGSYMDYVASKESGGNQWAASPGSTASGQYQMTQGALVQTGLIKQNSPVTSANLGPNGNWDNVTFQPNQWGITSREDLLNNKDAQTAIATQYEQQNWQQLQSNGTASLVGTQSPGGVTLNQSAILDCGYVLGAGGCHQYLTTGQLPSNAPAGYDKVIEQRMADASQYDASSITGANTAVDNSALAGKGGSGSGGSTSSVYCDPNVAQAQVQASNQAVQDQVALALNPTTGFSGLDGNSLIPGGVNGVGASSPLGGGSGGSGGGSGGLLGGVLGSSSPDFGSMSCLENIFNANGVDLFFSAPSIDQIMNMLMNAICQAAQAEVSQLTQPLTQSFNQTTNLGGYFPGMGLGSLGGGVNMGTNQNGGGLTTNLGSVLSGNGSSGGTQSVGLSSVMQGNNNWYSNSSIYTAPTQASNNGSSQASSTLGSLFGQGGGAGSAGGVGQNIQWNNP